MIDLAGAVFAMMWHEPALGLPAVVLGVHYRQRAEGMRSREKVWDEPTFGGVANAQVLHLVLWRNEALLRWRRVEVEGKSRKGEPRAHADLTAKGRRIAGVRLVHQFRNKSSEGARKGEREVHVDRTPKALRFAEWWGSEERRAKSAFTQEWGRAPPIGED
ncbi:hypothetical protein C8R48DRAFT_676517 [Suillus tomentosus]|nr:hypothetical protein C8R48DRAFT_676517 [Suillus tomentosus]